MSLVAEAVTFSAISLVTLIIVVVIATVIGHPYTTFESVTTFQLSMAVCWLGSIANTSKQS